MTVFPPFYVKERIAPFALRSVALFLKINHERIAQVNLIKKNNLKRFAPLALYKRATGGIHFFPERIALSLTKNEQIAGKTNERIPNIDLLRLLINILKAFQIEKNEYYKGVQMG